MSSRNPFVWTDLSSYDVTITQDFYGHLFGWEFQKVSDRSMAEDYHIAHHGDVATSAVFTMPEFFQKIELPSFYMSYISVDSLEVTLEKAEKHEGAKIEIKPTDFDGQSRIALLRDPAGAGFTLYEGPDISNRLSLAEAEGMQGRHIGNVLHVSDVALVRDFYEQVFNWTIELTGDEGVYGVMSQGVQIATIEEVGEDIRGSYQYWMPVFSVVNLKQAIDDVQQLGGEVMSELSGSRAIIADGQRGACMIQEVARVGGMGEGEVMRSSIDDGTSYVAHSRSDKGQQGANNDTPFMTGWKWKTLIALLIVWVAVLTNQMWIWGIIFLLWIIPDLKSGSTYFVEPIHKSTYPGVYWSVMVSWIVMILFLFLM